MKEQTRDLLALPALRAEEVLKRRLGDLVIDDGAELYLQANAKNAEYFARVHVSSVSDLQILGLVPRGLREETIRQAVKEDDKVAYVTARELASREGDHDCSCENKNARPHHSYSASFSRIYRSVRKSAHPALATVLSDHQRTEFRWDSTHVQSVKGWFDLVSESVSLNPIIVSLFQDIRIGRQSRLVLDPACVDLMARGIYIHRTGTLVHRGGYLRIWASQVSRYEEWAIALVSDAHIPWIVQQ